MNDIYFDNGATTKPSVEVIEKMMEVLQEHYGNPSSLHTKGLEAEKYVKHTAQILAQILKVSPEEIYFTSGGTESNNAAILGTARAYHRIGKHIITTQIEHPSVKMPFQVLEEEGFEVTYLPVDGSGYIDVEELKNSIRPDTILVSIMHVNNEIGAVQPIDRIGNIIKQENPNTFFHVDGIQSFGKYPLPVYKYNIDLLSISGHKFHGPKGIGALYKKKNVRVKPLLYGGSQQKGMRSGTENVPGIVGMGTAAEKAYEKLEENNEQLYELKKALSSGILQNIEGTYLNGPKIEEGAPHIINIGFRDIRAEVLLHSLETEGIYVSTRSACSSKQAKDSTTLQAIGLEKEEVEGSIRFSFSKENNMEQVQTCVQVLSRIVPVLRKFTRGGRRK